MNSQIKAARSAIRLLLISLILVIITQLLTRAIGSPPIPYRLFYFVIVVVCVGICTMVWLIARAKRGQSKPTVTMSDPRKGFTIENLAKILAALAIVDMLVCGIVSFVFNTPLRNLGLPCLLFFMPYLFGLPLLFHARQFYDLTKSFALRSAFAMAVFVMFLAIAVFWSGLMNWMLPGTDSTAYFVFTAIFATCVAFVGTYYRFQKRRDLSNS